MDAAIEGLVAPGSLRPCADAAEAWSAAKRGPRDNKAVRIRKVDLDQVTRARAAARARKELMRGPRRVISLVAATAAAVETLAACTADAVVGSKVIEPAGRGGTLTLLSAAAIRPWIRNGSATRRPAPWWAGPCTGRSRHTHRWPVKRPSPASSVTWRPIPASPARPQDLAVHPAPESDLAGRFTAGLRDVKHGIARTFATDVITGGSTDALSALAHPADPRWPLDLPGSVGAG